MVAHHFRKKLCIGHLDVEQSVLVSDVLIPVPEKSCTIAGVHSSTESENKNNNKL